MAESKGHMIQIQELCLGSFIFSSRFMFGDEVIFRSVSTALSVIYTAKKYVVRGLDTLALKYISKNINSDNVLLVLQTILIFYNTEHSQDTKCKRLIKTSRSMNQDAL